MLSATGNTKPYYSGLNKQELLLFSQNQKFPEIGNYWLWLHASVISEPISLWFSWPFAHDSKTSSAALTITLIFKVGRKGNGHTGHIFLFYQESKVSLKLSLSPSRHPYMPHFPELCHAAISHCKKGSERVFNFLATAVWGRKGEWVRMALG